MTITIGKILDFPIKGDDRGSLIALENLKEVPFVVQRVYYIFGTEPNIIRGKHAHITLSQVLICVSGSCRVLLDNGMTKETVLLNQPNQGLLITGLIWREMYNFSKDCVLLVLASEHYDEKDYIRDYEKFLASVKEDNNATYR